jgi:transcriptional regulator with XRE-family HTH domain
MVVKRCAFARARKAAGYTQESLAERLGVDRTTVARWEAGEYEPQPWQRPRIAEAFGLSLGEFNQVLDGVETTGRAVEVAASLTEADGALLAGYERVHAAKQEPDQRSREAEPAEAYADAKALRTAITPSLILNDGVLVVPIGPRVLAGLVASAGAELASELAGPLLYLAFLSSPTQAVPIEWKDQLYEQLVKLLHGWADTMDRRELLRLLGWAATTVSTSPVRGLGLMASTIAPFLMSNSTTDEQERFTKAVASPGRVDTQVIDHLEVMLQHCKRQQDSLGSQAVLHTVLAQRGLVNYLLDGCPDELRPRLLSVYSSMSISVGYYFFDLNDVVSAMYYCDQARAAAQEARNTEIAVYALCNMSYFASWQGKAHAGIDFAAAAQSLAGKTDDSLWPVFAAERAGIAYAVDGQLKECMTELDRAQAGLAASAGRIPPESPVYWYHEGVIDSQKSYCLLRLGQPIAAAVSAHRGLPLFDNSIVGHLAVCTLRLATARLQSGEIEEAARVLGDGALLVTRNRSVRLTKQVQAARAQMKPWEDTSAVKALDERLVEVGFMLKK